MTEMCLRCVMDNTAQGFVLNANGHCNFCTDFQATEPLKDIGTEIQLVKITKDPTNEYDCVVGVSGGVDSSMVLVKAVELGLKPLAVHMDNGWNSELSQNNISNLVHGLGVDLVTHVIDWSEYKKLMHSFIKANVIDIELLYDNAMLEVNYATAKKFGIKTILAGTNKRTEGMAMPTNWGWYKMDGRNIKSIANSHGVNKFDSFPLFTFKKYLMYKYLHKIKWISALDYLNYDKNSALEILQNEHSYKPYPYKHYESIFTRFYQGYILPRKFGVDKRKLHLSTLIITNQLTRDNALKLLGEKPYPDERDEQEDLKYFLSKMDFSLDEFNTYLKNKEVSHSCYKSEIWMHNLASWILSKVR